MTLRLLCDFGTLIRRVATHAGDVAADDHENELVCRTFRIHMIKWLYGYELGLVSPDYEPAATLVHPLLSEKKRSACTCARAGRSFLTGYFDLYNSDLNQTSDLSTLFSTRPRLFSVRTPTDALRYACTNALRV